MKRPLSISTVLAFSTVLIMSLQSAYAAEKEPVRIGAVTSLTGALSPQGQDVLRGIEFAVEYANEKGGVDGRKILLETGDDESTPRQGLLAAEKLARSGYNLLIGPDTSSVTLAIGQNLARWNAMLVGTIGKSDKITGNSCNKYMFRINHSDAMDLAMLGEWMKEIEPKNFAIMAADYEWGHDSAESFRRTAEQYGKKVSKTFFAPLGTKDFAPYISQIKADDSIDGVWVALVGQDVIAYSNQAKSFGLTTSKTTLGHNMIMDLVVDATGDATEGIVGTMEYGASIDTPENKEFVAAWMKKYDRPPTNNEGLSFVGVNTILEGVKLAGSVDPKDISKALAGASYQTVFGEATMRAADNQLVIPNYIGKVESVDGKLRPVVIETFPASLTPEPSGECKMAR